MLTAKTIIAQLQRRKIKRKYADGSADAPVQNQCDTETEGSTCQLVVQPMDDIDINVYLPALDFVLSYKTTRFDDNILPVVVK